MDQSARLNYTTEQIHIHTYIHTFIHTHIHTEMHIPASSMLGVCR